MPNWLLALVLKPFVGLCYGLFVWGVSYLVWRLLPDGRVKRALLTPIRIPKKQRVQPHLGQERLR